MGLRAFSSCHRACRSLSHGPRCCPEHGGEGRAASPEVGPSGSALLSCGSRVDVASSVRCA